MTFLTNIPGNHFSHNIFAVFYHSELKFSNLDPNWAKNRPLLLKTLDVSNCVDSCTVHSAMEWVWFRKENFFVIVLNGWLPSANNCDRNLSAEDIEGASIKAGNKIWWRNSKRINFFFIDLFATFCKSAARQGCYATRQYIIKDSVDSMKTFNHMLLVYDMRNFHS